MSGFVDRADVDFIVNGAPEGAMANDITSGQYSVEPKVGFDAGLMRPVIMPDGKRYCKVKTGRMVANKGGESENESKLVPLERFINSGRLPSITYNAALPHDVWQRIDRAVIRANRDRLNAWNDLAAVETYGGFDGMAITGLIRDTMTDPLAAKVDMDTLSDDFSDAPIFTPDILPLPIIHAGASISQRRLAQSRNGGMPLDTTLIEAAGRRCAEVLEQMTIGITDYSSTVVGSAAVPAFTNKGIYGYVTHPNNIDVTGITATASFVAQTFYTDVLSLIEAARAQKFYGPFNLYCSTSWDQYLEQDYFVYVTQGGAAPTQTVRQRVEANSRINKVAVLDMYTTADKLLLVQMTSETVRAVVGMEFTTVQWVKDGGAQTMLRVMGIKVPDIRSQYVGTSVTTRKCGVVYGGV